MTLPIVDDDRLEQVIYDRPGDDLYPEVKPLVEEVDFKEKEVQEKLVNLLMGDMALDAATANSCDKVGKVLTYLAQKWEIEPAEFIGDIMMRNFSRISKLKLSLDYAEMIGLEGDVLDLVIKAEVERLWGDTSSALIKKMLVNKSNTVQQNVAQQPSDTGVKGK